MPREKHAGPTSLRGHVGGVRGGMPALPTHSGQMVASRGGLALPSAEAPSNLSTRRMKCTPLRTPGRHRLPACIGTVTPREVWGKYAKHPKGPSPTLLSSLRSGARAQGPCFPVLLNANTTRRQRVWTQSLPSKPPVSCARPRVECLNCHLGAGCLYTNDCTSLNLSVHISKMGCCEAYITGCLNKW